MSMWTLSDENYAGIIPTWVGINGRIRDAGLGCMTKYGHKEGCGKYGNYYIGCWWVLHAANVH